MRSLHSLSAALHKVPCVSRLQIYMLERINKLLQKCVRCVHVSAPRTTLRERRRENKFVAQKSAESVSSICRG